MKAFVEPEAATMHIPEVKKDSCAGALASSDDSRFQDV